MLWAFEGTCLLLSCPFLCQAVPVPLGMASLWSHCLLPPTLHNCLQLLQVHFGSSMMTPSQLCVIMTVLFLQGHLYSNRAKYLHIFLYKKGEFRQTSRGTLRSSYRVGLYSILQITWCEGFNPSQTWLSLHYSTQTFYRIAWEIANENSNLCFLNFGVMDLFKNLLSATDPISS